MLDLIQLTDLELRTLFRAQIKFKECEKGISEHITTKRLVEEMKVEYEKRGLQEF